MMDKKRRLIYLDDALRELKERCDAAERLRAEAETEERRSRLEDIEMAFIEAGMTLKDLLAVEERPRSRWKVYTDEGGFAHLECAACGGWMLGEQTPFCPYCGARMDVEEEE